MDADTIATFEEIQRKLTLIKRLKTVLEDQVKQLKPKFIEHGKLGGGEVSLATPLGGQIIVQPPRTYISSIPLRKIETALANTFSAADTKRITSLCRTFLEKEQADKQKVMKVEYRLAHPNVPGKTIEQKNISLAPNVETQLLGALGHTMNTEKLQVCATVKKERSTASKNPQEKKTRSRSKVKSKKQQQKTEAEAEEEVFEGDAADLDV